MTIRTGRLGKNGSRRFAGFSGRASQVPVGHGSWRDDGCYSRVSKGWKPEIETLGNANACPNPWGPYGPERPPNISGDPVGYNTKLWPDYDAVGEALLAIGYRDRDGNTMTRQFQTAWNGVVSGLASSPDRFSENDFAVVPRGLVKVDGAPGPQTLNALEIALANQQRGLDWVRIIQIVKTAGSGYGREKLYNAAQGGWLGAFDE